MRPAAMAALWAVLALPSVPIATASPREERFTLAQPAEVQAVITARGLASDWGVRGREGAVLRVHVDGKESSQIVLARGATAADYAVALGPLPAGAHRLRVEVDRQASAPAARDVVLTAVRIVIIPEGDEAHLAAAFSPLLYPRPDALRRFSDVPLLLWYEVDETPRGRRFRYSVVFSNEDGGTPPDRLMATWGRLTDIEFVYGVEVDAAGRVLEEAFQGRGHRILPFRGRRLGRHPILHVVTDNNMLDTVGPGKRRHALAPFAFSLAAASREAVMDAHPWTYAVSSRETLREGRVRADAVPGSGRVPDPRRFLYLEACADVKDAALTFAAATRAPDGTLTWHRSDDAETRFRIARSADHFPNGCFRGAVALPARTQDADLAGLRFRAYTRQPGEGEPPLPAGSARASVRRVSRLFRLDDAYTPGADLFTWTGDLPLPIDGDYREVALTPVVGQPFTAPAVRPATK